MKTYVAIFVVLYLALAPRPLRAQYPAEPPKFIKIILHPMTQPRPALRYRLLPSILDTRPGNAAVWWNRLPAERTTYFRDVGNASDATSRWLEIPLNDPREKEFRAKHPEIANTIPGGSMFADMVRAARFESCDWQLPIHEGNAFMILLPELQQLRTYGRMLAAKARLEIAEGKYDQAVETLQTGFALARDAAKAPTLINALVGSAIAGLMTNQIEQFVQRPDAPNLYWALATLPQPLIDYRPGFEAESNELFLQFPELRDVDKKEMSAEEWRSLLHKVFSGLNEVTGGRMFGRPQGGEEAAFALQGYPLAKQYLIEHGRPAAEVEAMPVAKVLILYSVDVFRELSDEVFKTKFMTYADGKEALRHGLQALKTAIAEHREIIPLATLLLPAVEKTKVAETRVVWNCARLRILEALRIYAAAHDGELPDRLEDITEAPIPRNPFDDKPFDYHRDGDRAVLDCQDGPPGVPWRYEITMLTKGEKP